MRSIVICFALLPATHGAVLGQEAPFTDPRDGNLYETVTIGYQVWHKENLRYDPGSGTRCYGDVPVNCHRYGRLYDWATALQACPPGWRLPSEDDWRILETTLGMDTDELSGLRYRGEDEGEQLRIGGDSGFDVFLSGYMRPDGTPRRMNERAAFWTATEHKSGKSAWHRDISTDPRIYRSPVDHEYFLSVRCMAEGTPSGSENDRKPD